MPLRDRHLWIFDLDGTLTVAAHDFAAIRAELGLPEGEPILEALARLPRADAAARIKRLDEIELGLARTARPAAGAAALLVALRYAGARVGILTRNSERNAWETLAACGLDAYFAPGSIIDRDAAPPKPSPGGVERLLAAWGGTAQHGVVVGDYLFDLQAGREAGALTVHVDPSGAFAWSAFADLEVRSLAELEPHARRLGQRR